MNRDNVQEWDKDLVPRSGGQWSWHVDLLQSSGKVEIIRDGMTIAETYSIRNAEQIVDLLNRGESLQK